MKIAFLSFYSGSVYRGVETFVHELGNRLISLGHEVTVYQGGPRLPGSSYKTVSLAFNVDSIHSDSNVSYLNYWARLLRHFSSEAIKRIDPNTDIIFPTNGQWQSLLCSIWAKRYKKKIVISGQSGPGLDDRLNLFTFPNVFVGLTDFQVKWAKRANPFVKVRKIPNGVDLENFDGDLRPIETALPRPIILCVAAFDYWKRQDLAIKAVSRLGKGSLLLVGKGAKEKELIQLGEKLLPGRFEILSFPYNKMPHVYPSCDLFTYPTVPWESFGIVLVEAMASGLGVVAADDPIRREIVGDAGVFVDPTNIDAYSKGLEFGLETKWGNKPRNQAEKYDWDRIAKQYESLFMENI